MLELDHIAVIGETLEEAVDYVEQRLHTPMLPGGAHERFGTHNRLLGLSPQLYLEAIAIDPGAPPPQDARWFGMDDFVGPPRLDKWICRVGDLDAALKALPMAGRRVDLARDGLRWSMAVPEDGRLPFDGLFPALIQWDAGCLPPGKTMPGQGAVLEALDVAHPQAGLLRQTLAPFLDTPLVRFHETEQPMLSARIRVGGSEANL